MCGRFTLSATPEELFQAFSITAVPAQYTPRYNIAPTQYLLAVLQSDNKTSFEYLQWGFIPFWAKDPTIGSRMINARSETLDTKKSFKASFEQRRCLVAADGFYEWRKQGKGKTPVYIFLKPKQTFAFAGLWSQWKSPEGNPVQSCTIITTQANSTLKPIHDRMPVILEQSNHTVWLDPKNRDTENLKKLLVPYDASGMEFHEISTWVNSPGHEGKRCTERV